VPRLVQAAANAAAISNFLMCQLLKTLG
jgi:hypothetical protein